MKEKKTASGRDGQNVAVARELLREAILSGRLEAGEKVSQKDLERELEVGGTPLREAMRMLETEGLLLSQPNRGVRVAGLSAGDAEELYVMRITLETVAIRLTVPQLEAEDIAELEGCMAKMDYYKRTGNMSGVRQAHKAFHRLLVGGAGQRLTREIGELSDHAARYQRLGSNRTWDARHGEHRAILDAAAAADAKLASAMLAHHYAHSARIALKALAPDHDPALLELTLEDLQGIPVPGLAASAGSSRS